MRKRSMAWYVQGLFGGALAIIATLALVGCQPESGTGTASEGTTVQDITLQAEFGSREGQLEGGGDVPGMSGDILFPQEGTELRGNPRLRIAVEHEQNFLQLLLIVSNTSLQDELPPEGEADPFYMDFFLCSGGNSPQAGEGCGFDSIQAWISGLDLMNPDYFDMEGLSYGAVPDPPQTLYFTLLGMDENEDIGFIAERSAQWTVPEVIIETLTMNYDAAAGAGELSMSWSRPAGMYPVRLRATEGSLEMFYVDWEMEQFVFEPRLAISTALAEINGLVGSGREERSRWIANPDQNSATLSWPDLDEALPEQDSIPPMLVWLESVDGSGISSREGFMLPGLSIESCQEIQGMLLLDGYLTAIVPDHRLEVLDAGGQLLGFDEPAELMIGEEAYWSVDVGTEALGQTLDIELAADPEGTNGPKYVTRYSIVIAEPPDGNCLLMG